MISPIKLGNTNFSYNQASLFEETKDHSAYFHEEGANLSGYKAGRAMFLRNNITFRNLPMPIEVTDKYNKKIEGKDHLDLPNIHVYEYPDTNLKIVVDKTDAIKESKIDFSLSNTNTQKIVPMYDNLLYQLLKIKIKKINQEANVFGGDNILSYTCLLNDDISKINDIIFNIDYEEKDLEEAKKALKLDFNSFEYNKRNMNHKYLYSENSLYDKRTCENRLNAISLNDLKKYHKEFLKNSCATVYAVIKNSDFDNKYFFKLLNENINLKLKQNQDFLDLDFNMPQNKVLQVVENKNIQSDIEFDYSYFIEDEKEYQIAKMLTDIIITSEMFKNKDYYSSQDGFCNNPINLMPNKELRYDNLYYKFEFFEKNLNVYELVKDFKQNLQNLYDSDLTPKINKWKETYKDDFKYEYDKNTGLSRLHFLQKYNDDIFHIYEIIDSITQDDIKEYLKKYLIDQEPIIHVRQKNEYPKN
ncbi:TPA: hypothetical protein CPU00_06570 [Candidatus Gastranaerophilales bacterium HUM_18]|nr:MAG TPA: hypothetical protein CPU00_06570 [Candidatus Gastranaerophilales bacterium HUM_18]